MVMYYVDLIEKWSHYNPGQPRDNNGRWRDQYSSANFGNGKKLSKHFKNHGAGVGASNKEEYLAIARELLSQKREMEKQDSLRTSIPMDTIFIKTLLLWDKMERSRHALHREEGGNTMKNKKQNKERELFPCPVCGALVEVWEICDVCEWQNDGPGEQIDGGPNEMTYAEAVEHWNKHHTKVK